MYREVAKLLLYSGLEKNGILLELADIVGGNENG